MITERCIFAVYRGGRSSFTEIEKAVTESWSELLSHTQTRDAIAGELGVDAATLTEANASMRPEADRANLAGGELIFAAAFWFGKEVLIGLARDAAKDAVKKKAKKVWEEYVLPRAQEKLDRHNAIGQEDQEIES